MSPIQDKTFLDNFKAGAQWALGAVLVTVAFGLLALILASCDVTDVTPPNQASLNWVSEVLA